MRADRLITTLLLLQRRGRLSAPALARELEVSTRTVMRDLEALGAAGVPIYSVRGPKGGYELWDGFRLQLTGLTTDEVRALFLSGPQIAVEAFGLDEALRRARLKILRTLPSELSLAAGELADEFHHDPRAWDAAAPLTAAEFLATSIRRRRVVTARDTTGGGYGRPLTLHPLGLVLKAGHWYLVAAVDLATRVVEVDQLMDLANTGDRFSRPPEFNLRDFWASWVIEAAQR
jgi:predicted DNA-binding transcriptional regulator YafY